MGKSSKFIGIEIVLILFIIGCFYFSYFLSQKISLQNKKYQEESSLIVEKKKELAQEEKKIEVLEEAITKYQDIDSSIQKLKDQYFQYIKDLETKIMNGESTLKIAYLTFDDGPYYNTYNVLNILDQYDVKATFFTISMNGEYCYDNKSANCFLLYKEYVKRGHTIANHTYTHGIRSGLYNSVNSFMDAINRQEEHVKNQTEGYLTNIVRFPGGSSTAKGLKPAMIEALQKKGYGWVDWNAGDGDGGRLDSTDQAWSNLKSTINENIEVILFHDYSRITTSILSEVIVYLRDNGYQLYPLFYDSVMVHK